MCNIYYNILLTYADVYNEYASLYRRPFDTSGSQANQHRAAGWRGYIWTNERLTQADLKKKEAKLICCECSVLYVVNFCML
jgi:hypothetical protein